MRSKILLAVDLGKQGQQIYWKEEQVIRKA
jgi:hypothetical protein